MDKVPRLIVIDKDNHEMRWPMQAIKIASVAVGTQYVQYEDRLAAALENHALDLTMRAVNAHSIGLERALAAARDSGQRRRTSPLQQAQLRHPHAALGDQRPRALPAPLVRDAWQSRLRNGGRVCPAVGADRQRSFARRRCARYRRVAGEARRGAARTLINSRERCNLFSFGCRCSATRGRIKP